MKIKITFNSGDSSDINRDELLRAVPGWKDVEAELIEMRNKLHAFVKAHEDVVQAFEDSLSSVKDAYEEMSEEDQDDEIGSSLEERIDAMEEQLEVLQDLDLDEIYESFESLLEE